MMAARSRFTSASISFQSCSFMSHLFLIFNALQIALFEQPHRSCIIALLLLTCIIDSAYSTVTTYEAMQAIADDDTSKAGNAQAQVVGPEEIKHVTLRDTLQCASHSDHRQASLHGDRSRLHVSTCEDHTSN